METQSMYDLIQKIFRRKLEEGKYASHTPSNLRGDKITVKTTQAVIDRVTTKIENAKNQIIWNPNYGSVYHGDGVYQIDLYPNGELVGRQTSIDKQREPGTYNDVGYNKKRSFFVKSCTRIQHPDQPKKTCTPVGMSPMEDAAIKVLAYFGPDILTFLKMNMAGEDEYTTDTEKDIKQKDFLLYRKKERKDTLSKQKELAKKNPITLSAQEEKIAVRNYALKHGISQFDIDMDLRKEILRQYQQQMKQ